MLTHGAAALRLRRFRRRRRPKKRTRKKSRFAKYCKKRAKRLGTNVRAGNPFDIGNRPTVCARCDKGQRRRCARLAHCRAKFRSPPNVNRREQARFAARQKKVQKREARWVMSAATNVVQTTLPYADMPIAPLTALISGMMDVLLDDGEEEDEDEDEDDDDEDDEDDEDPGDGDGVYGPSVRRTEEDDDNSGGGGGFSAEALIGMMISAF